MGRARGQTVVVRKTADIALKTARFQMNEHGYEAIEQNQEKPESWGKLAREGHRPS